MGFSTLFSCNRCRWELSPPSWPIYLIMVNASATSLDRFVRRVYRRLVVLRLLEWAGMGFAAGCAVALVPIILLRNRAESGLSVAAIIMGIGATVGFLASLLRRPKIIDAAAEADRQLGLADLLATAWQLEKSPPKESFEDAVLLIANDRAAHLQPHSVILHRLGVRAWGGIGLAGALVLTVTIFTANPLDTEASSSPFFPQAGSNRTQQDMKTSRPGDLVSGRRPTAIAQDHPNGGDDPLPGADKTTDTANASPGQNTNTQATNPSGGGTGAGKSPTTPNRSNPAASGVNSSRTSTGGNAASGVGISTDNANTTSGNASSTSAGSASKSPSAPAWKGDSWPAAQQAADTAITTGQIPPAYHDLVREYFKR